jgi:hypothetical protein
MLIVQFSERLEGVHAALQTDKRALTRLAGKLANNVPKDYKGRWCFFAGFAFVLNGVEKNTYDIDVLAKDRSAYKFIFSLLPQLGLELVSSTSDFSTFKVGTVDPRSKKDLTLDLLCVTGKWLKPLKGMWTSLEEKKIDDSTLPVASPVHLILLKMLVNSHRPSSDRKKKQDMVDVRQLMFIRGITAEEVSDEARIQGIKDIADEFLERLSELSKVLHSESGRPNQ